MDAQTLLSDAQALTVTAVSTNTYDTGLATTDISVGEPVVVEFAIDVAADGTTTDETYVFNVISSAAANLGTPTVLVSRTLGFATLVAGYSFYITIPSKTQRYLGVSYTLGGTTPSVTVTASIKPVRMTSTLRYYPDAINIS